MLALWDRNVWRLHSVLHPDWQPNFRYVILQFLPSFRAAEFSHSCSQVNIDDHENSTTDSDGPVNKNKDVFGSYTKIWESSGSFFDSVANKQRKNTFSFAKTEIPAAEPVKETLDLNSIIEVTSTWAHMDQRATNYLLQFTQIPGGDTAQILANTILC